MSIKTPKTSKVKTIPQGADVSTPASEAANVAPPATDTDTSAPAPMFDFAASGRSMALSEGQRARLLAELGEALKLCTNFTAWDGARVAFMHGAELVGYAAPQDLWERTVKAGQALGLIPDKPKAETTDATKKAAQRAKAEEKVKAAQALGTPAEIRTKAATELAKGNTDKAAEMLTAAKMVETEAHKAAKAKAAEVVSGLRTRIAEALARIKASEDVKKLRAAALALEKISPAPMAKLPA